MNVKFLVLSVCLLAGCATTRPPSEADDVAQQPEVEHPVEMQAFFANECPISGVVKEGAGGAVVAAIFGDVIGKLASNGVDALGKYLSADKAVTFEQSTRMDGFAVSASGTVNNNPATRCVVLVAASDFGKPKPPNYDPLPGKVTLDQVKEKIYALTRLSGSADFYMELGIKFNSKDTQKIPSSSFTYEPRAFYYPNFLVPSGLRYSSRRDILLQFEISQPSEKQPFATFTWQWTGVKKGGISEESVVNRKLPWSSLPEELSSAGKKAPSEGTVPIFPVNVKVMLTETAKPHVILKYIGEALVAQKDTIVENATAAATQAVSEQARLNARQAASDNVKKKYADYTAAYDTAKAAQAKYAASTDTRSKQQNLATAKQAYLDLDLAEASIKLVYGSAGIGPFSPLEQLPKLPEKI
jgi:hypothetical protein